MPREGIIKRFPLLPNCRRSLYHGRIRDRCTSAGISPAEDINQTITNDNWTSTDTEMSELPWYKDGLPFECTQCGDCCTGAPGFVWVNEDEVRAIADYLDKPIGEIRLLYTRPARGKISLTEYRNGDCVFFDPNGRGCTIYPVRPVQCRTWPFWGANVESPEAWKATCQACRGSGRGELIPLEIIQQRVSQTGH